MYGIVSQEIFQKSLKISQNQISILKDFLTAGQSFEKRK